MNLYTEHIQPITHWIDTGKRNILKTEKHYETSNTWICENESTINEEKRNTNQLTDNDLQNELKKSSRSAFLAHEPVEFVKQICGPLLFF